MGPRRRRRADGKPAPRIIRRGLPKRRCGVVCRATTTSDGVPVRATSWYRIWTSTRAIQVRAPTTCITTPTPAGNPLANAAAEHCDRYLCSASLFYAAIMFRCNGHVIHNLFMRRSGEHYVGLFGDLTGGRIEGVGLRDARGEGHSNVGGLAGEADARLNSGI